MSEKGDENAAKLASYADQLAASKSATAKAEAEALRQKLAHRDELKSEVERRRAELKRLFNSKSPDKLKFDFYDMLAKAKGNQERIDLCEALLDASEGKDDEFVLNVKKTLSALKSKPVERKNLSISEMLRQEAVEADEKLKLFAGFRHHFLVEEPHLQTKVRKELVDEVRRHVVPRTWNAAQVFRDLLPGNLGFFSTGPWISALWADCGMPVLSLTDSLFATLILTDPPPFSMESFKLPFPVFYVVPPHSHEVKLFRVFLAERLTASDQLTLNTFDGKAHDHVTVALEEVTETSAVSDNFNLNLCWRLVRNLVAWIAAFPPKDPEGLKKGEKYKPRTIRRDRHGNAAPTTWVLGREVKLGPELRRMAAEYAVGESKRTPGWKLGVRYVVRGHWKMQPHGPGRTERKRIFIEPYWKGPEGAAAFSHVYKLTEEEK